MSADPADIQRAIRRARTVTREDSALLAKFPSARDGQLRPEPGFFESASDAEAALAVKATLLTAAHRFTVRAQDHVPLDPLDAVPTWQVVDAESGTDRAAMVSRYEYDLDSGVTTQELVG